MQLRRQKQTAEVHRIRWTTMRRPSSYGNGHRVPPIPSSNVTHSRSPIHSVHSPPLPPTGYIPITEGPGEHATGGAGDDDVGSGGVGG